MKDHHQHHLHHCEFPWNFTLLEEPDALFGVILLSSDYVQATFNPSYLHFKKTRYTKYSHFLNHLSDRRISKGGSSRARGFSRKRLSTKHIEESARVRGNSEKDCNAPFLSHYVSHLIPHAHSHNHLPYRTRVSNQCWIPSSCLFWSRCSSGARMAGGEWGEERRDESRLRFFHYKRLQERLRSSSTGTPV